MNVIEVKGLSKKYRIGKAEKRSDTIFSAIANGLKSPLQNLRQIRSLSKLDLDEDSVFWALRDVSFEVKQGEVLGIIGHNGAGKSTLLKILSRITEPSEGEVRITGRVAALLEVGTGFHPELTGRENIYMNGTILGMRKREIDKKLDEIVDFSGVEKFLDTPVKFYSSGMRVRLGFSVAAHLEPDILIIDEVLAVGDAEFQAKCLGKMEHVAGQGRTVLFVSHDMAAINTLCKRSLLLQNGMISFSGGVSDTINYYLLKKNSKVILANQEFELNRTSDFNEIILKSLIITSETQLMGICTGNKVVITLSYALSELLNRHQINFALTFKDKRGNKLFVIDDVYVKPNSFNKNLGSISFIIDYFPLVPGIYNLDVWVAHRGIQLIYLLDEFSMEVVPISSTNISKIKTREKHGSFVVPYRVTN